MSSYDKLPLSNDGDEPSLIGPIFTASTIAAAGVLYLLTRHPLLAAILPWLHGGWPTFNTGLWILRTDPVRTRARVCFTFYLAAACWIAGAVALATGILLGCVGDLCGAKPNQVELLVSMLSFAAYIVISSLIALTAVIAALATRVRVCVRTNLKSMLRNELSRAAQFGAVQKGPFRIEFLVVVSAAIVPLITVGMTLLVLLLTLAGDNGAAHPKNVNTILVIIACVVGLGLPLIAIPIAGWLYPRVVAKSPQECWPAGTC
jgi:hypothetical protein